MIVTSGETRVIKQSAGDFDCDDEGVTVSQHASTFSKEDESEASADAAGQSTFSKLALTTRPAAESTMQL